MNAMVFMVAPHTGVRRKLRYSTFAVSSSKIVSMSSEERSIWTPDGLGLLSSTTLAISPLASDVGTSDGIRCSVGTGVETLIVERVGDGEPASIHSGFEAKTSERPSVVTLLQK